MSYSPIILSNGSTSASANLTVDLSSFYNIYNTIEVEVYAIQASTDNVSLNMLVSADGTTFDNTSGNYQYQYYSANAAPTSAAAGTNSASAIQMAGGIVGSGALASATSSFVVRIDNPSSTSFLPILKFVLNYVTTSNFVTASNVGTGTRVTAQITKALRFSFSSGNITASYRIKGYK